MLFSQFGKESEKEFLILSDDKWENFGLLALKFISSVLTGTIFVLANLELIFLRLHKCCANFAKSYQEPKFGPTRLKIPLGLSSSLSLSLRIFKTASAKKPEKFREVF